MQGNVLKCWLSNKDYVLFCFLKILKRQLPSGRCVDLVCLLFFSNNIDIVNIMCMVYYVCVIFIQFDLMYFWCNVTISFYQQLSFMLSMCMLLEYPIIPKYSGWRICIWDVMSIQYILRQNNLSATTFNTRNFSLLLGIQNMFWSLLNNVVALQHFKTW